MPQTGGTGDQNPIDANLANISTVDVIDAQTGTFDNMSTNATGIITANRPGTSPTGSQLALSSPASNVGLILTGGNGSGGILRRWDLLVGSASGNIFIRDETAGNLDRFVINSVGSIGMGTSGPVASAKLEMSSTTQGLLPPRMDESQRDAIGSPATGLEIYNTDTNLPNFFNGTIWVAPATSGGTRQIQFSAGDAALAGVSDPGVRLTNISEMLSFSSGSDQEVFATINLPDDYSDGTDFILTFSWSPEDATAGNVIWGVESRIVTPGADLLTGTTVTQTVTDAAPGVLNQLETTAAITISGTAFVSGDVLYARLFRNGLAGGDTYGNDANLSTIQASFTTE